MSDFFRVVAVVLTDNSVVHDVVVDIKQGTLLYPASDQAHAERVAAALNAVINEADQL